MITTRRRAPCKASTTRSRIRPVGWVGPLGATWKAGDDTDSTGRELLKGKTKKQVLLRVIRRGLLLVLLGVIANNGLVLKPFAEIRFASVLGRIGLAYIFANIIWKV